MKKQIPITDLAYTAGYIDGDGCFYLGKEGTKKRLALKFVVRIAINSVNQKVLQFFKKLFGGRVGLIKKQHDNSKSLYQFSIGKNKSILMAKIISPFLIEKKQECQMLLDFSDAENKEEMINQISSFKDIGNLISKYQKQEFEKYRNTINPTQEDYAYLAGFIDAECCFLIQKEKPKNKPNYVYKIVLSCNNTKSPVFKWLLQRFGGRINFIDRLNNQRGRKNQFQWRLTGKELSKILGFIHPYLQYKKPVCEQLMKFYATTLKNGGARHTEQFRESYSRVIEERERIIHIVHQLNKKGISL
jgi:hypothetical protein